MYQNNYCYSNAVRKVKCFKNNNCCVNNVITPTGSNTVTVNVGSTTTGMPGTNAQVINSGTDKNVILDFIIPSGTTPELQIGSVETGEPGSEASVTISELN